MADVTWIDARAWPTCAGAWAHAEGITNELLSRDQISFQPSRNRSGTALGRPGGQALKACLIKSIFDDAYQYMKSGHLLRQVLNKVKPMDFNDGKRHLFGDIYEQILKDLQGAGNAGSATRRVRPSLLWTWSTPIGRRSWTRLAAPVALAAMSIAKAGREHAGRDDQRVRRTVVRDQYDCPRHRCAHRGPARQHLGRPTATSPCGPGGCGGHQSASGMEEDGIESNFDSQFRTVRRPFVRGLMEILTRWPGGGGGTLFGEGVARLLKVQRTPSCGTQGRVRPLHHQHQCAVLKKASPPKTVLRPPVPGRVQVTRRPSPCGFRSSMPKRRGGPTERIEQAWRVGIDQIRERGFNLDIKNPEDTHEADVLLARYTAEGRGRAIRGQLKQVSPMPWWAAHDAPKTSSPPLRRWRTPPMAASARAGAAAGGAGAGAAGCVG